MLSCTLSICHTLDRMHAYWQVSTYTTGGQTRRLADEQWMEYIFIVDNVPHLQISWNSNSSDLSVRWSCNFKANVMNSGHFTFSRSTRNQSDSGIRILPQSLKIATLYRLIILFPKWTTMNGLRWCDSNQFCVPKFATDDAVAVDSHRSQLWQRICWKY